MSNIYTQKGIFCGVFAFLVSACGTGVRDTQENLPPIAKKVLIKLEGNATAAYVNSKLSGDYDFSDPENDDEGATRFQWLRDGKPIDGATQQNYTVVIDDSGKTLQFQVTPKDVKSDIASTQVTSAGVVIANSPPTVSNVRITTTDNDAKITTALVQNALTVHYDVIDVDGDALDPIVGVKWINDQNMERGSGLTYTVQKDDLDHTLHAEVSVKASAGDLTEQRNRSANDVSIQNSPPVVNTVTVSAPNGNKPGNALNANFSVSDPNDDKLSDPTFQWRRSGVDITGATKSSYIVTMDDLGKDISVEVTPHATEGIANGNPKTSDNAVSVPLLTAITVSTTQTSIEKGDVSQFTVMGTFSDQATSGLAVNKVNWATSAPSVATVKFGAVSGVAGGKANISAYYNSLSSNNIEISVLTHLVSGNVLTDKNTGLTVSGVKITLINTATQDTKTAYTDAVGHYQFDNLVNDDYIITPSRVGSGFVPPKSAVTVKSADVDVSTTSATIFNVWPGFNDTGITNKQCFEAATVPTQFITPTLVDCATTTLNYGQDGMLGRDANAATNSDLDGKLGFSFTKVCNNGQLAGSGICLATAQVGPAETDWGCTLDNVTGLMWELKTHDDPNIVPLAQRGLRDDSRTYSNYSATFDSKPSTYGTATDATGFVNAVNGVNGSGPGICGYRDWRLPTAEELLSIVDYGVFPVSIDTAWFPHMQDSSWSSSPFAGNAGNAWVVSFRFADVNFGARSSPIYVVLVRAGQ